MQNRRPLKLLKSMNHRRPGVGKRGVMESLSSETWTRSGYHSPCSQETIVSHPWGPQTECLEDLSPRRPALETGWEGKRMKTEWKQVDGRPQSSGRTLGLPCLRSPRWTLSGSTQTPGSLGLLPGTPLGRQLPALPVASPAALLGAPTSGS